MRIILAVVILILSFLGCGFISKEYGFSVGIGLFISNLVVVSMLFWMQEVLVELREIKNTLNK